MIKTAAVPVPPFLGDGRGQTWQFFNWHSAQTGLHELCFSIFFGATTLLCCHGSVGMSPLPTGLCVLHGIEKAVVLAVLLLLLLVVVVVLLLLLLLLLLAILFFVLFSWRRTQKDRRIILKGWNVHVGIRRLGRLRGLGCG